MNKTGSHGSQRSLAIKELAQSMPAKIDIPSISNLTHKHEPAMVTKEAEKLLATFNPKNYNPKKDDPLLKVMSLREFEVGLLLSMATSTFSSTFAIDLMRKITTEYNCETVSEKAIVELATASFVRALDIQKKITDYLDMGSVTSNGVQYLGVLSKDLDRAHHQYLSAIQTLKSFRQPPMQVNIKSHTTVIGQNQLVQTNEINDSK